MFKSNAAARVIAASLALTAFAATSFADMVYDEERTMSAAPTTVEVKNVINGSEAISTAPVVVETQRIQKASEKSREKRNFHENVNNELVIQKLEDRRLKQEEKLTAEINKRFTIEEDESPAGSEAPVMKEEKIVKPIASANSSYEMSAAPQAAPAPAAPVAVDQVTTYQSSTSMSAAPVGGQSVAPGKSEGEKASKGGVSIIPRAGLSTISNDFYDFRNQYVLGFALGFDVSDHVAIDLGYTYADYQVGQKVAQNFYGLSYNQLSYKNNTFDFGMKLFLTGLDAKVRPFVGGGMAYSLGYVNYDERSLGNYAPYFGMWNQDDYQLNQFQGMLQAGLDFKIASNISIGAAYKYFKAVSTTESQPFYNGSFYTPYAPNAFIDPNKLAVSRSLRDSDLQMFLVNATVTF